MIFRKTIGRVLTNLVKPETYDLAEHVKQIKESKPKAIINAIKKDKPIYDKSYAGRDTLWRNSFDLPTHKSEVGKDRKVFDVFTDKKGKIQYYGLKPGSAAMDEVAMNVAEQKGIISRRHLEAVKELVDSTDNHSIMGGYNLKIPNKGKGAAKYKDVWDFGVNKGERLSEYVDSDKLNKKIKPNKATKAIDKLINKTKKVDKKFGNSKTSKKIRSGLEVARVVAQPENSQAYAINKARNVLNKITKHPEIKGDLVAPKNFEKLDVKTKQRYLKKLKSAKNSGNEMGAAENGLMIMYDDLLSSGAMKPMSKYKTPLAVKIKNVKKSKYFGVTNPKQIIKDLKETTWEHRRAVNTLAEDKVVKQTLKQKRLAERNALLAVGKVGVVGAGVSEVS